ncbi:hypothetical protein LKO27_03435 [Tessaracoccus sp. OS52]|uniref:hypothetical protein n=1 Tax=Tessaracoccus sp. OS52 TaxID=2886691 RepID=UPI001D12B9AD|nr:hypothetical protein [Tessaracoccus sp. OS52]MCC2592474.1 hypothetical protein [Tessaracoccus sp. OS52]
MGLALQWGRQVLLVEADPVGGSAILAGHYRGGVANPGTLVDLWVAQRQGRLPELLTESVLRMGELVDFIPGPAGAAQAASISGLWPALAYELRGLQTLGVDVIIDYGRIGHACSAVPLLKVADQVLVVMRADLVSVAAVAAMTELPTQVPAAAAVIGAGRPSCYSAAAIGNALKLPVEVELPWEPREATVLSHGTLEGKGMLGRPRQLLRQQFRTVAQGLQWRAEQRREELNV